MCRKKPLIPECMRKCEDSSQKLENKERYLRTKPFFFFKSSSGFSDVMQSTRK